MNFRCSQRSEGFMERNGQAGFYRSGYFCSGNGAGLGAPATGFSGKKV